MDDVDPSGVNCHHPRGQLPNAEMRYPLRLAETLLAALVAAMCLGLCLLVMVVCCLPCVRISCREVEEDEMNRSACSAVLVMGIAFGTAAHSETQSGPVYVCPTKTHPPVTLDFGKRTFKIGSVTGPWSEPRFGTFMISAPKLAASIVTVVTDTAVAKYPIFPPPTLLDWIAKERPEGIRVEIFDTNKTPGEIYGQAIDKANDLKCDPTYNGGPDCGVNVERGWCDRQ